MKALSFEFINNFFSRVIDLYIWTRYYSLCFICKNL